MSYELGEQFYKGFSSKEVAQFEAYLERIISNLKDSNE